MSRQMARPVWDDERLDRDRHELARNIVGFLVGTALVIALIVVPLAIGGLLIKAFGW